MTLQRLAACLVLVLIAGCDPASQGPPEYRVGEVTRGPLRDTVSATGTLRAVVTVDVGTQVSGLIKSLNADFNSDVTAGQVIARIDPAPFEAQLAQARAELAVARSSVTIAQASLVELEADLVGLKAALTESRDEYQRRRSLLDTDAVPQSLVDTAQAELEQAEARVRAGDARLARQRGQIELARARVQQEQASVQQRELDLGYTEIRSPVDGVVIARNVDAGQTVAASLQAPTLFRIAGDLRRMEVFVSVDEADIGRVKQGQTVYFGVDAFLSEVFTGRVHQVRKLGLNLSNVVTYDVVASVDNRDGRLLPGMTANVSIVVDERADVLQVPVAALNLRLPGRDTPPGSDTVWVLEDGEPRQVPVVPGLGNGQQVEVVRGELAPGAAVVVGVSLPG